MPEPILIESDSERPLLLEAGNTRRIVILGDNEADIVIGDNNTGTIVIQGANEARIQIGANNRGHIVIRGNNTGSVVVGDGNRGHIRIDGANAGTIALGNGCGDPAPGAATVVVSVGGDNEGNIRVGSGSGVAVVVGDVNQRAISIGDDSRVTVQLADDNEGEIRVGNGCKGSIMISDVNQGSVVVGHGSSVAVDMKNDNEGTVQVGDGAGSFVRVGDANQSEIRVGSSNTANVVVAKDNEGSISIGNQNAGSVGVHGDNEGSVAVGDRNTGRIVVHEDNEGAVTTGAQHGGVIHVVGDNEGAIRTGEGSGGGIVVEADNEGAIEAGGGGGPVSIGGDTGQVSVAGGGNAAARDLEAIHQQVQELIGWIKAEAARQVVADPVAIDVNSSWYRDLLRDLYLAPYLAAPSPAAGAHAVQLLGLQWEGLTQFNKLVVPSLLGEVLEGLPPQLGAATGVVRPAIAAICPNIDGGFLLGKASVAGLANDPLLGGRNWSQMMHWATGVKYHHVNPDTMHVLFLGYEIWHMEGWEVFGEDAINDLIAEEQGRLLGRMLAAGEITAANMAAKILESAVAARAWVGSLIAHRRDELDAFVAATAQQPVSPWLAGGVFGIEPAEEGIWSNATLFQELASGKTVAQVKNGDFVKQLIGIYRLIAEAERYEAAHGAFVKPPLLVNLLDHQFDDLLSELAVPGFPGPGFIPDAVSAVAGVAGN